MRWESPLTVPAGAAVAASDEAEQHPDFEPDGSESAGAVCQCEQPPCPFRHPPQRSVPVGAKDLLGIFLSAAVIGAAVEFSGRVMAGNGSRSETNVVVAAIARRHWWPPMTSPWARNFS